MNRRLPTPIPTLPLALLLCLGLCLCFALLAGCEDERSDPTVADQVAVDDYENMDFSQPHGGLTASDEWVAFGDASLEDLLTREEAELVQDEFADDDDVVALLAAGEAAADPNDPTRPRFTFLRLAWGMVRGPGENFELPSEPCDALDWTGEIHTDRGIVLVRRLIRFEEADYLARPRPDRRTVAFASHTSCGSDGLLLQIIERPVDYSPENTEPNHLRITTGPFSGVYTIEELAGLDEVHEIDHDGNIFQLNGFNLSDVAYCPKGFLGGRYRLVPGHTIDPQEPSRVAGRLTGVYRGLGGRITGFLRGAYGFDAEGERVFHGKYIDRLGHFRGFLGGVWVTGDDTDPLDYFQGHWINRSGKREGLLSGRGYPVAAYPGGFFEGRWTTLCDDQAEEQVH